MIKNKWTEEMIESVNPLKIQINGGEAELHLCKTDYCNGASTSIITVILLILPFAIIFSQCSF